MTDKAVFIVDDDAAVRDSLALLLKLSGNPHLASIFWLFGGRGLLLFLRGYAYLMAKNGRVMSRMIAEDVSKISTESFFQSIAKRSGPIKGSGIGLSVARECIEAQGGSLSLATHQTFPVCFRIICPAH